MQKVLFSLTALNILQPGEKRVQLRQVFRSVKRSRYTISLRLCHVQICGANERGSIPNDE